MKKTKRLSVSAVMLALATALSFIGIRMPFGGAMTLGSMIPVILVSYLYGTKWALGVAVCYSLIQMICGFTPPPVPRFSSIFAVCLLDYILAFAVLGLGNAFSYRIKNVKLKYATGSFICVFLRFLCHFFSGILIWNCYAPEGQNPAIYSLLYNGGYMGGELILTVIVMAITAQRIENSK